jgi:hypothetical protein
MPVDLRIFQPIDPHQKIGVGLSSPGSDLTVMRLEVGGEMRHLVYLEADQALALGQWLVKLATSS